MELSNFTGLLEAVNEGEELRRYKKEIKREFTEEDPVLPEIDKIIKFGKAIEKYLDKLHSIRDDE